MVSGNNISRKQSVNVASSVKRDEEEDDDDDDDRSHFLQSDRSFSTLKGTKQSSTSDL